MINIFIVIDMMTVMFQFPNTDTDYNFLVMNYIVIEDDISWC